MDINKISNKLNLWRHKTNFSLYCVIISAIGIGFSVGLQRAFLNIYLNYLSTIFGVSAAVSLVVFVLSAIRQSTYEEKMTRMRNQLDSTDIVLEIEENNSDLEKDISKENVRGLDYIKKCQILLPNSQAVDNDVQTHKVENPSNNRVLQLLRKKHKK